MDNPVSFFQALKNKEITPERIRFILMNLFVGFLPFDKFYTTLILYLLIATTLIDLKNKSIKKIPSKFWVFQLVFILSVFGYFYSSNKAEAGFLIEKQLVILIFPLLIPFAVELNSKRIHDLFTSLTLGCLAAIIGLFIYVASIFYELNLPADKLFNGDFFNHNFSDPIGIHAGYLSLYVSISCLFVLKNLMHKLPGKQKVMHFIALTILLAGLVFLASRNVIIASLLIFCFVFPWFYIKRRVLFMCSMLILLSSSFLILNKIDYFKDRFSTQMVGEMTYGKDQNAVEEPRIARWNFALELIKKSPVIGYGSGDEVTKLKTKYKENGFVISYFEKFNAHNQYLSVLLKHGIIGFIFFLGAFGYYLKLAFRAKDFMYLAFLCLLIIGFFTENILDANKGIFFFAFFNTLLGYKVLMSLKKEDHIQEINNSDTLN